MNYQTVSTRLKAYLQKVYSSFQMLYHFFKTDKTIIHAIIISFLKTCFFYFSLFDIPHMLANRCCIYLVCILKYSNKRQKNIQYLCIEKAKKLLYFLFNILSFNGLLVILIIMCFVGF